MVEPVPKPLGATAERTQTGERGMGEDAEQRHEIAVGFLREECDHLLSDIAAFESGTLRLQHRTAGGDWIDTSAKRVGKLRRLLAAREQAIAAHERDMHPT